MKLLKCLILYGSVASAWGQKKEPDTVELLTEYSLPDMVHAKSIPANWELQDSASFTEGRVILTPKEGSKGSMWLPAIKPATVLKDAFTLEWTFRSINFVGTSPGGLSFWVLNEEKLQNKALYNGPSNFNGMQVLVDNNGRLHDSIKAQLNDGTEAFSREKINVNTFASCLLNYQESAVPLTVRLTYDSKDDHFLKLQIDNRVCFQTRKVKFDLSKPFKFGVSAENSKGSPESFEILKMKLYNGVTQESLIPNSNAMSQPQVVAKVIDESTGKEKLISKEELDASKSKLTNYQLYKKLDNIEGKIIANDIKILEDKMSEIIRVQDGLNSYISHLNAILDRSKNADGDKTEANKDAFKDFFSVNEKLEALLDEQQKIREITRHGNSGTLGSQAIDQIAAKLLVWLVPLGLIMVILAYYTFKINQDIKKTKLL